MIDYDFPLWRPPSEGDHLIIQATLGCSFNACAFCSMYKDKGYRERPLAEVLADIDRGAEEWPRAHRVFLADGDAYGLSTDTLAAICDRLAERLPLLQRVSAYATPINLVRKSADEIRLLKSKKLSLVYLGIETGSDLLLKRIAKGSVTQMEAGLVRAAEGGLKVSATVITGLGGKAHWQEHIDATAALINRAPPTYLSTLQLGLEDGVAPRFFARNPDFEWQDDQGVLLELVRLVERLDPPHPVIFRTNHASNALALAGTLPKDRDKLLAQIEAALAGTKGLRPLWMRGL
ncbi:MAG: radical SAM protein [Magnetospirillum sp.]|nr:radical SAM protein [Magnetospirillum sp.]